MGRDRELKDKVEQLSYGVLNTVIDTGLFIFAFWAQSYSMGSGKRDVFEAITQSAKFVRIIKSQYFKRALYRGSGKGLFQKGENGWEITELGRKKLAEILPKYCEKRPWEGKIYLITYDIPEKRKKDRECLREYLRRMSCGMLQASVWLTPYNPKNILTKFVSEKRLTGFVVVSDIGKDGNVGQMPIRELVWKVYNLDGINDRYAEFLKKTTEKKLSFWEVKMQFLSILKDDPQLPFGLLPGNWLGDKAYRIFLGSRP